MPKALGPAALMLLTALSASAQTAEPVAAFYSTATVRERPLSSATGAVTVIGAEEIERSGARSVAELLRTAAGLNVTTNATRGGFTTVEIRGGDPNFTLVLLDGVPLNDPTYPVGDAFNLEGLPALAVERIEIVRGPLSSFYGSTGLAGVVNILTRRGGGAPAAQLAGTAGDASLLGLAGSASGRAGSADYFVAGSWEREEERVAAERFREANVHANLGRALGSGGRLQANSRYAAWEGDDYPDASGGPLFGSGLLRASEHREASLALDLDWGRQRVSATAYRHDREVTSPAVGQQVPASREDTRFEVARLAWSSVVHRSERLQTAVGADLREERGDNESALLLPPQAGGEIPGDYSFSRTLGGAYVELVAQQGDWTVELSSRLDLPEGRGAEWSPRLGASYRLGATTVRGSLGRAWKLPSFFALASPPQLGGNPDLRPETVWGGDLGVGWKAARGSVDLTAFYNRYDDLVDFDFATFRHVNRNEVEARGAELAATWQARDGLTVRADAGWQRVEDRATGLGLRHRPEWTGSLRLDWKATERLSLRLDARAVDRRLDQQIPVPERQSVAGYAVVGLGGALQVGEHWQIVGRIDNATDTSYQELIGFPGPGRSARLTLRRSFGSFGSGEP